MNEDALNDLHAQAAAEEAAPAPAAAPMEGEFQAARPDPVKEWADTLGLVVAILTPALPFLPGIYTDTARQALATAIVPVCEKYGFDLHDSLGKWAPEIGLALVAGPLAVATVKEFRAFRREQAAQAQRDAEPKPADATA